MEELWGGAARGGGAAAGGAGDDTPTALASRSAASAFAAAPPPSTAVAAASAVAVPGPPLEWDMNREWEALKHLGGPDRSAAMALRYRAYASAAVERRVPLERTTQSLAAAAFPEVFDWRVAEEAEAARWLYGKPEAEQTPVAMTAYAKTKGYCPAVFRLPSAVKALRVFEDAGAYTGRLCAAARDVAIAWREVLEPASA